MDDNSLQPREGVSSAASVPAAAAGQAEKTLGEAGEAVLSAGRDAAQAASRHVEEQPLLAVIVGFALGYIAALLVHGHR
jgi:ElaB/YqjD/DUF883 family membrane-anchored ribosome-binding protein